MREAVNKMAAIPSASIRLFPVELVIDHSVQVGPASAPANSFDLKRSGWSFNARRTLCVSALGTNIISKFQSRSSGHRHLHQVNLEYLARVVCAMPSGNRVEAYPDRSWHGFAHHDGQRARRFSVGASAA